MLQELLIKNFAIIDELSISFHAGLNVLTGETGAGKTIIISALDLVLGGKAFSEYIRAGEDKAVVEACFDISGRDNVKHLLSEYGIDFQHDTLILKRQLSRRGRSSCYANGGFITLNCLARLGQELIDIHGQHEHQLLLRPDTHIDFLDAFGDLLDLRQEVTETYNTWQEKRSRLCQLAKQNQQREQRRQLLEFQMQEIDSLGLEEGEQEALLRDKAILQNAGKLLESGCFIYEAIYNAEGAVRDKLAEAKARLAEMGQVDASLIPLAESLESIQYQLDDIAFSLKSYTEKIEYDPERQQEIENRLAEIEKLERKYGGSLAEVYNYRRQIEDEYQRLTDLDSQIESLSQEIIFLANRLNDITAGLSEQRKQASRRIDRLMSKELGQLGMEKGIFATQITPLDGDENQQALSRVAEPLGEQTGGASSQYSGNAKGIDQLEFLFTANMGEEARPLAKIASGGELSRMMLALKGLLAGKDRVPTLIFDEVDAGIGGRIAEVVGKKLKSLAASHQIVCITHLPQIAAFADYHYTVEKGVCDGRTVASIKELDQKARVTEIARLLAGEKITSIALEHAREMVDKQA
jgi:DNA repair protein RecN (Recombination protein N)